MPEIENQDQFIKWFRYSSPYINAHRGKTFVILLDGEAIDDDGFPGIIHDIALLNSLDIKLVLVHGARPQINKRLKESNITSEFVDHIRITDETMLPCVKQAVGSVKMDIEAMLSMGVANSPMAGSKIRVVSGNFVTAKPIGIQNGKDFGFSGEVRRIDHFAIQQQLDDGSVILLSSIAGSPTGETFNLKAEDVAVSTAIALSADKFIHLTASGDVEDNQQHLIHQMTLNQAKNWLRDAPESTDLSVQQNIQTAIEVCSKGIDRAHIIHRRVEGALLLEMFTRNGVGTLITTNQYDIIRQARIDDIGGILELIEPLENQGILVRRSRERLETEINHFTIMERDGMIIACVALFLFKTEKTAELACLAVHKDYQRENRGESLLSIAEKQALQHNIEQIFVLTSRTSHWFVERGFLETEISLMPVKKQQLYNYQRKSKVFIKSLAR